MFILFDTLMLIMIRFFDNDYFDIYLWSYFNIYIHYYDIYDGIYSVKFDVFTMLFMLKLPTICLFALVCYLGALPTIAMLVWLGGPYMFLSIYLSSSPSDHISTVTARSLCQKDQPGYRCFHSETY